MENLIYVKNGGSIKEAQLKARALDNVTVIIKEGHQKGECFSFLLLIHRSGFS